MLTEIELLGNSRGIIIWEMHATGESAKGLGWAIFIGKEFKEGESSQSLSKKLIGLIIRRDSWQMFIGQ